VNPYRAATVKAMTTLSHDKAWAEFCIQNEGDFEPKDYHKNGFECGLYLGICSMLDASFPQKIMEKMQGDD